MEFTFPLNPVPASRPRVSRWGTYFSGPYKDFRAKATEVIPRCLGPKVVVIGYPIKVDLEVFPEKPKTSKLAFPKPDVDNYAKAILDACNGILWEDDSLIKSLYVTKDWSSGPGYFVVSIERCNEFSQVERPRKEPRGSDKRKKQ